MKDFLDKELNIGDEVIVVAPSYRQLIRAKIIAFTPKQVRVSFQNTWNYNDPGKYTEFLQPPDQLVKVVI
jgi:hypothetical protein